MQPGGRSTDETGTPTWTFPFSRAFAQAGFTRVDAETWRRAGWHDPVEAARWYRLAGDCTPRQLQQLCQAGVDPTQVARVARFASSHTAAWTRAFLAEPAADDVVLDLASTERAEQRLRDEVLANLHRGGARQHARSSVGASGRPRP